MHAEHSYSSVQGPAVQWRCSRDPIVNVFSKQGLLVPRGLGCHWGQGRQTLFTLMQKNPEVPPHSSDDVGVC